MMDFKDLYKLVLNRKKNLPKDSYATSLFKSGRDRVAQKVGEESVEVVIAAKNKNRKAQISELADLLFHIIVLMVDLGITLKDIEGELKRRHKKG